MDQFMLAVGELALVAVGAITHFGIIFAYLGFELNQVGLVGPLPLGLARALVVSGLGLGHLGVGVGLRIL